MKHCRLSHFIIIQATFIIILASCNRGIKIHECVENKFTDQVLSVFNLSNNLEDSLVEHGFLIKNDINSYKHLVAQNLDSPRIVDSIFYSRNIDAVAFISSPSTQSKIYSCFNSYFSSGLRNDRIGKNDTLESLCYSILTLLHESFISSSEELDFFFQEISNEDLNNPLLQLVLISLVFIGGL